MAHIINSPFAGRAQGKTAKVYQHRQADSQSLPAACALVLAENTKARDLSLFELINIVNRRITDTDGLDFVDKHTLFKLYVNIDTELESRRNAIEDAMFTNAGVEHAVNPLGNGLDDDEHVHASEITMAEWEAVRNIHAEVYSDED